MPTILRKFVSALLAGSVVLGAAGCANRHQEAVSTATSRWLTMRSAQMLALGHQQFEVGALDQAEKTVRNALAMDMKNPRLHVLAARIALERGYLERSYHLLASAIEFDPKLANAHYYQGLVLQRWRQLEGALNRYQRAYELEADNVAYLLATSEMLVALDRTDEAVELLESKVTYFEQNVGIREAIGQLYNVQGQYETAVNYFREAALLQPDDLQIREELAMAQLAAGQAKEALPTLKQLCAEPDFRDRGYLSMALVTAYRLTGRLDDARSTCTAMTRHNPENIEAWRLLAELAWAQQDLAATLTAAGRVYKLAPQDSQGYVLAGLVWQQRGQTKRALQLFDRAAKVDKTSAEAAILYGIALEDLGQPGQAANSYREALRRDPSDQRAQQLLWRIEVPADAAEGQ
jgi:tetratricopeptide (TPR) repeat protein